MKNSKLRKGFVFGLIIVMFFATLVINVSTNVNAETPISDSNLKLYYSFDDYTIPYGGVKDDSGNDNHGGLCGDTAYVSTTKFGRAVRFDGNGDFVDMGLYNDLKITGDLTIEAWIFWQGQLDEQNPTSHAIVVFDGYFGFYIDNNDKLRFESDDISTGSPDVISSSDVPKNKWTHVAVTRSGSGTSTNSVKLYINGILDKSWYTYAPSGSWYYPGSIGGSNNGGSPPTNCFNGIIDEVKVFDKVLTLADGLGTCVLKLGFEEGAGTKVFDRSGNNLEGTINGGASWIDYQNVLDMPLDEGSGSTTEDYGPNKNNGIIYDASWVPGKVGNALSFDGMWSRVNLGSLSTFNPGKADSFSIEAWIKVDTNGWSDWARIIDRGGGNGLNGFALMLDNNQNICLNWENYNGAGDIGEYGSIDADLDDNQWHHVKGVFNRGTISLYVDGKLQTGTTSISSWAGGLSTWIGGRESLLYNKQFDGLIDEIRIIDNSKDNYDNEQKILRMPFDEGQGSTTADYYGQNQGQLGSSVIGDICEPSWTSGIQGIVLSFDGTDDYVDLGSLSTFNPSSSSYFSIEAWIKVNSWTQWGRIIDRGGGNGLSGFAFMLDNVNNICLNWEDSSGSGDIGIYSGHTNINDGNWHHIKGVYDASSISLYVDGILQTGTTSIISCASGTSTWIGGRAGTTNRQFNGKINDVRIVDHLGNTNELSSYSPRCLDFDGTDDYVKVNYDSELDVLNGNRPFTIEARFKLNVDVTTFSGDISIIHQDNTYGRAWIYLDTDDTDTISTDIGGSKLDSNVVPEINTWYHTIVTHNGGTLRIYVNGELTNSASRTCDENCGGNYLIGKHKAGGYFNGQIDDVRIYNYEKNIGGEVLRMPFEGALWTDRLKDRSVYDNNGIKQNSPNNVVFDIYGKYGGALDFDGNDYLVVSDDSSLDLNGDFTIEAWINVDDCQDTYLCIVDKYQYSAPYSKGYTFYLSNGKLRLSIYSNQATYGNIVDDTDLRGTGWHHVAGTFDGSKMRLYIDGILEKEKSHNVLPSLNSINLGIGKRLTGWGGDLYFKGLMDNLIISNYAKTFHEDVDGDSMTDGYEIIRSVNSDQYNPIEYNGRYAVLFCWDEAFWTDIVYCFETLRKYGYFDCDIIVLNQDSSPPDHAEYFDDIITTIQNFEDVLGTISDWVKESDFIYIYGTGHGTHNSQYTQSALKDFDGTTEYWDDDFADDLDQITDYHTMVIALDTCYSGGFIDDICANDRITLTSAAYHNSAWVTPGKPIGQFPEYFTGGLSYQTYGGTSHVNVDTATYGEEDGIVSISEAFNYAIDEIENLHYSIAKSYLMYDDDGIANNPQDQIDTNHPDSADTKPWGNIDGPGMHLPTKDPNTGTYLKDHVVPTSQPTNPPTIYWIYDYTKVTDGWDEGILGGKTYL